MCARGEWLADNVAIIRVWNTDPGQPGPTPAVAYDWSCVSYWLDKSVVEIKAASSRCTPDQARSMVNWLRSSGATVWFSRRVDPATNQFVIRSHRLRRKGASQR